MIVILLQGRTIGEILNEDIDIDGVNLGIKVDEYYTQALESLKPKDKPNFFKRFFANVKTKCLRHPDVYKLNKNLQDVMKGDNTTLEYLINVYDQLSVYGGNLRLDTHRVVI